MLELTNQPPDTPAILVDLSGEPPAGSVGVALTLIDPYEIIGAARAANHNVDWVLRRIDMYPGSERQAAAFALALNREVRGTLFVVTDATSGRCARILGHMRRAGCG